MRVIGLNNLNKQTEVYRTKSLKRCAYMWGNRDIGYIVYTSGFADYTGKINEMNITLERCLLILGLWLIK